MLGQLRQVADEIVVAADARADEERLRHYTAVADRLTRIEFSYLERHLAWLHEQCSGEWVLRLDGDEVPSPALIEQLPQLMERRDVQQYLLPRRWLFGDSGQWLDEPPWSPDYQIRLVRNTGLQRYPGILHGGVEVTPPVRYLEAPIYHLACLLSSEEERRSRALWYEVQRPGLRAPGTAPLNHGFYLPERWSTGILTQTPAADRAAVDAVLAGVDVDRAAGEVPEDVPVVTLAENDRSWAKREVPDTAYRAEISSAERTYRMAPGECRPLHVRVANLGSERWPSHAEQEPLIRMSYRWYAPAARKGQNPELLVSDGERTPFGVEVRPGDATIVPLLVTAPAEAGRYLLEVDIVHEFVRWFDCPARITVQVDNPPEPLARDPAPARSGLFRRRRQLIPRIVHRTWLGWTGPMPDQLVAYGESWSRHHPDWEMRLWTAADLPDLVPDELVQRCRSHAECSDLMRFELLRRHGGVYLDTDFECLRPLDPLLQGVEAFAAWETDHRVGTAILGCVPGHPAFERAARESRVTVGLGDNSAESTGPGFWTTILIDHPEVCIFPIKTFYPYGWDEPQRRDEAFRESYAVHHWDGSWLGTGSGS